mgnify:CR=1 FL=1
MIFEKKLKMIIFFHCHCHYDYHTLKFQVSIDALIHFILIDDNDNNNNIESNI